jgi:hypothetical protein
MKNRVDIKDFILKIEKDFPVNNWTVNGIHLWPIIRIRLFFYLINVVEGKQQKQEQNQGQNSLQNTIKINIWNCFKKIIKKILLILKCYLWIFRLPQKENLFIGSDSHRVNYRGFRFNRYFDVLIEKYNLQSRAVYFEYGDASLKKQYNRDLISNYDTSLKGFLQLNKYIKKEGLFCFDGYQLFLDYLNEYPLLFKFTENNSSDKLKFWADCKFLPRINFFASCLKQIQPKKVIILCYYSDDIMALVVAANQLCIETIEMQHGPQTDIHLSYGSWSNVPALGYGMLPRTFWCWDSYSENVLKKWIDNNTLYSTKVSGNPWVNYWQSKNESYPYQDYIFYSLQTNPITIEQLFPENIIYFIKNESYKWFIRLHPRQLDKLDEIQKYLQDKGILHLVNISNATNDSLPQILSNSLIHITHFSGSALEAINFNVLTVLINKNGLSSFPELIQNNQAVYLDYEDQYFGKKLIDIIEKNKRSLPNSNFVSECYQNLFI